MQINISLKKILPHIIAVFIFFIVSSIYFYPAYEGKSLQGEDVVGGYGKGIESDDYKKFKDTKLIIWNGSLFSGMPNYISQSYKGTLTLNKLFFLPQTLGMPGDVFSIFYFMIGIYILLITFGVNPTIAIGGAIVFSLTTYNNLIIEAGHYTKIFTLIPIPLAIAGMYKCFKKRYVFGLILISISTSLMISMAHIQIVYYFLISAIIIVLIEFYTHLKKKTFPDFVKSGLVIFISGLLAISLNFSRLANYYKYNQESIRGKNELTIGKKNNNSKKGLDKDYINSWSSGRTESMMIFVPNVKGGSTGLIGNHKALMDKIPNKFVNILKQLNTYWGNQPFSGGPNYFGSVVMLLFFIGSFLIRGKLKITILSIFVLMILLSLGRHLSFFTDIFIDYVPYYNKFRAPVTILGVLVIFVVFFSFYTLHKIIKEPELLGIKSKLKTINKQYPLYLIVGSIIVIFLLLNILFPELINTYISEREKLIFNSHQRKNQISSEQISLIIEQLINLRISVFRYDLLRTGFFILLTLLSIHLYYRKKINPKLFLTIVVLLSIIDIWSVSKRYVSNNQFRKKNKVIEAIRMSEIDKKIFSYELENNKSISLKYKKLQTLFPPKKQEEKESLLRFAINSTTHYRVYNKTKDPFNENFTSAWHKSIGGYHAVKLRRYQDLIEHHISKNNMHVLNMLNTKYVVTRNGLQLNKRSYGNGWFVDSIIWAENADEEILALNKINNKNSVIINAKYKNKISNFNKNKNGFNSIELISYEPDYLVYNVKCTQTKFAIFSEIFYPDWKLYIDGNETEIIPANYVLRAAIIPPGNHKLEFIFDKNFYHLTNRISQIFLYFFLLSMFGLIGFKAYKQKLFSKKNN